MLRKPWKVFDGVSVYGNHHSRPLLDIWELDEHEIPDWIEDREFGYQFFRYKDELYCTADFTWPSHPYWGCSEGSWMREFDGVHNDSFFSGVLFKYVTRDYDETFVKVYTFIA